MIEYEKCTITPLPYDEIKLKMNILALEDFYYRILCELSEHLSCNISECADYLKINSVRGVFSGFTYYCNEIDIHTRNKVTDFFNTSYNIDLSLYMNSVFVN